MDFIDGDWRVDGMRSSAIRQPVAVVPCVTADVPDFGRGARPCLGGKREGVRLFDAITLMLRGDGELVERARADSWNRAPASLRR